MLRTLKIFENYMEQSRLLYRRLTTMEIDRKGITTSYRIPQEYYTRFFQVTQKMYTQTIANKCWKCGAKKKALTELFCENCKIIQNPSQVNNYFKLFGLHDDFSVNQKILTQKYREMQNLLHPDKFSNRPPEEQKISEDFSSLVNKAYNVLQSPLDRAIHLLSLRGERIEEDQKVEDPAFLMEIMELNEEIEAANLPEKLKELNIRNKKMLETIANNIDEYFKKGDIQSAKKEIIKMKYYNSVHTHVNFILRERGIVD